MAGFGYSATRGHADLLLWQYRVTIIALGVFGRHVNLHFVFNLNMLRPRPGTSLPLCRLVIYIWHILSTSDVLAVAMSYIACVWCGSGLDNVALVGGHVCGEVLFTSVWYI